MEVDTASSVAKAASSKHLPAELEIYCYFILLLFLVDHKKYNEVIAAASYVFSHELFYFLFFIFYGFNLIVFGHFLG